MMMDYRNLLWCVCMMVWGFIVCLLLWTKSSSTVVKRQVSWSTQIGVRNLLFWKKNSSTFCLPFLNCQWHLLYTIILGSCHSVAYVFISRFIFLIYKIHTQRSLFYRYFSLWSAYIFLEDSKPNKSLNCYFKYLFYFLCICSPNSYLTLWVVNPW